MRFYYWWIFFQCWCVDKFQYLNMKQYVSNIGRYLSVIDLLQCVFINSPKHIPPHPHQVKVIAVLFIDSFGIDEPSSRIILNKILYISCYQGWLENSDRFVILKCWHHGHSHDNIYWRLLVCINLKNDFWSFQAILLYCDHA